MVNNGSVKKPPSILAVIPARGGSKRIPRKNIIDFEGKPLIYWTIQAAIKSEVFSHVLVSTDDQEIADLAVSLGAAVPFLRESASDDLTPVSVATLEATKSAEAFWGMKFDSVVQLMANCPIRDEKDIISHVSAFYKNSRSFQISAFQYGWMNPWWAAEVKSGTPTPLFPNALKMRSQDLPNLFCPTGSIWIAKTTELEKSGTFYGDNYAFEPISWQSAVDIDERDDLDFAKAVFMLKHRNEQ